MRGVRVSRGRRRSLPMTDTHDSYLQSDARQEAISAQKELFLRGAFCISVKLFCP